MNIIRIALIAPQEKDRQQLREQMFSYAVRWNCLLYTSVGNKYTRKDIIEELNRLSSAIHIMMCMYLAGQYR